MTEAAVCGGVALRGLRAARFEPGTRNPVLQKLGGGGQKIGRRLRPRVPGRYRATRRFTCRSAIPVEPASGCEHLSAKAYRPRCGFLNSFHGLRLRTDPLVGRMGMSQQGPVGIKGSPGDSGMAFSSTLGSFRVAPDSATARGRARNASACAVKAL